MPQYLTLNPRNVVLDERYIYNVASMFKPSAYGTSARFTWSHQYLVRLLTTGKKPVLRDPLLISAFTKIDRKEFLTSFSDAEAAYLDRNLPIGYSEVMASPTVVARLLQLLEPKYGKKYLELGTGTGYATAILASLAGKTGQVYSLERIQWLWEQARANLQKYPQTKEAAQLLYRDGSAGLADKAPFDGIICWFLFTGDLQALKQQLAIGGKLIIPQVDHTVLVVERHGQSSFEQEIVPDYSNFNFGQHHEGVA